MIDQPELGQKLLALRKEKGITQQELRDVCHVSVRTIQRIETGAVMPRVSTIKILMEALGQPEAEWLKSESGFSISSLFDMKNSMLINTSERHSKQAILPAAIAGIVLLFMNLLDFGMTLLNEESGDVNAGFEVTVKMLMMISFYYFTRGFIALGLLFENYMLRVASYLYIVIITFSLTVDIVVILFFPDMGGLYGAINAFSIISLGAVALIFGMALKRLQDGMGRVARISGTMEIVYGISYMTLIFSFISILLLFPLLVIEIVLLFKADQVVGNE